MKYIYKIRLSIAVIIFILAILGITGLFYPVKIFDIQFGALLQRVFVDFSIIAVILLICIIVLTVIFGRIYCSMLCPFGIMQEIAAHIIKKENEYTKNNPLKYYTAAIVFGILTGTSALALKYFEPYTYFGSLFSFSILGIIAAIIVLILVFLKNRIFCTNVCPVGALLGLLSKLSLNKLYIQQDICVSCGMCQKNCPSGCINSAEKTIDNETCIKCMKCIALCPKNAINYGKKPEQNTKFSLKRRQIIISASVLALFGAMIKTGIIIKDEIIRKYKDIILPPGAVSEEEFINKCFNCNLCVSNCPNKIIVKSDKNFSAVHIDYNKGYCEKNCNKCTQICPTGAIRRINLEEKQKTRIALAAINNENCTKCGVCISVCPYNAITKDINNQITIDGSKCTGCGKCKSQCYFNAINIYAVKKQSII
ncbi:MAG: 4Fe-4S binding protein [Candidatus Gastranaerophilales bacterium]|nr:4Fe-4S binding protein [Candidatus Gastranaerophilales bacterium]